MEPAVFPALELEPNLLQHGGQVATLDAVETAEQFSGVNPFGGVVRKLDLRQDTLWKQALLDIPGTVEVDVIEYIAPL